jgi:prepilin-type N-terminal cleavage/methylation domain-containing protein/prepilin-type processing-associated H-X9-DG protein
MQNTLNRTVSARQPSRGFTLIEVLVVIGIVSVLAGLLMGGVTRSRRTAWDVACRNNLRQLGIAVDLYANNYEGYFPPLGYEGETPLCYWWGTNEAPPDYGKGFLAPYVGRAGEDGDVYQCPEQPFGSYTAEGVGGAPTTTYGYNGYFLCPPATPGWDSSIANRPWKTFQDVESPTRVFMFADALLNWGTKHVTNTSFLDPPFLYTRGRWRRNTNPTTAFRHSGQVNACFIDCHVEGISSDNGSLTEPAFMIGYVGQTNAPHYVPDYEEW